MDKLEKILMPMADVLTKNRVLIAIRDGFLISTPLLIVGSIFLLIANFPIPGWDAAVSSVLGAGWTDWFKAVSRASFNCTGLLTALGTGYAMAREFKADKIQGAAVALVSYFILMPTIHTAVRDSGEVVKDAVFAGLDFDYIGPNGIFMALICATLGVWLFAFAYKKGWTIKMPKGVPPAVADSFAALVPSGLVMGAAFLVRIGFSFTEFGYFQDFVVAILQTPLEGLGDTLGANALYSFMCTFFWFFGINGPAVCNSVFFIGNVLTAKQLIAFEAGKALPYIFTNPFSNFFCNFGGGGSTLSLVILMVTVCKSERIKQKIIYRSRILWNQRTNYLRFTSCIKPSYCDSIYFSSNDELDPIIFRNIMGYYSTNNRCKLTLDNSNWILRMVGYRILESKCMANLLVGIRNDDLLSIH